MKMQSNVSEYKKKEIFNISIEGRKLEVNVESDIRLDNGVRFKNRPFEIQS